MRLLTTLFLATLLLSACATGPGYGPGPGPGPGLAPGPVIPNPGADYSNPNVRQMRYVCDDLTTIMVPEGSANAVATLNSGLELGLVRQPAAGGFRYGGQSHEFRGAGADAVWQVGGKTFRCRAR